MALQLSTLNWTHIVNAVKHEMNDAIAQAVQSASSNLGDLNEDSGDNLIDAIKQNGKRTLTPSEDQYLRSLITRATAPITPGPPGDS